MKPVKEFFRTVKVGYMDLSENQHWRAVLIFAFLAVTLFWVFSSLQPVLLAINRAVAEGIAQAPTEEAWERLPWVLLETPLALLVFAGLLVVIWGIYRDKRLATTLSLDTPEPHKGLIFLLSPYFIRSDSAAELDEALNARLPSDGGHAEGEAGRAAGGREDALPVLNSVDKLRAALEGEDEALKRSLHLQILASNWGPLWVAVQHHRTALQHCWLVCTEGERGSLDHFAVAQLLIQHAALTSRPVTCESVSIKNANDVVEVVPVVDRIYASLPPGIGVDDVIADFTGGTAAMTGGMILATLDAKRKIQYLRQDRPLLEQHGHSLRYLTQDEIRADKVLVTVETEPKLVPSQSPARATHTDA